MKDKTFGLGLIKQAKYRKRDALSALGRGEWAYATHLAQESVELYMKGLVATMDIDYPKRHDFAGFLSKIRDTLPKNVRTSLDEIVQAVDTLNQLRSPSFYGVKARREEPDDIIDRSTAEKAIAMLGTVATAVEADLVDK